MISREGSEALMDSPSFDDVRCKKCGRLYDFFVAILEWEDGICEQCRIEGGPLPDAKRPA
jgi:hypothetical protein